jgi:mycofactocin precursor
MDKRASSTTPETAPPADTLPQEEELLEDDLLVEDVSIDGMCGVY